MPIARTVPRVNKINNMSAVPPVRTLKRVVGFWYFAIAVSCEVRRNMNKDPYPIGGDPFLSMHVKL